MPLFFSSFGDTTTQNLASAWKARYHGSVNNEYAVVLTVVSDDPQSPEYYKALTRIHEELVHISVEVNLCPEHTGHGVMA